MAETNVSLGINASFQNVTSAAVVPVLTEKDIWPWRIGLFGVGGACFACVGVVCGIITIIVLAHYRTSRSSSSAPFLLICLEAFDIVFLVSELFLENLSYMTRGGLISERYKTFILPVYCVAYPVPHVAWTCATFMVVVITLERCVVVAWPLSAHRLWRPSFAKVVVPMVLVGSMLYHIPMYMAFKCPKVWNNDTQTEKMVFRRTEFGDSYYFVNVHMTWLKLCVNFLIPFILLLAFNILLLTVLWQGNSSLLDKSQRQVTKERKLTSMVVCMTVVFFLCQLLSAVAFILTCGLNKYVECSYTCNKFTAVADTLVIVNAAANFAIYCASGRKFRDIFAQLFLKRSSNQHSSGWSALTKNRMMDLLTGHSHSESRTTGRDAISSFTSTQVKQRRSFIPASSHTCVQPLQAPEELSESTQPQTVTDSLNRLKLAMLQQ